MVSDNSDVPYKRGIIRTNRSVLRIALRPTRLRRAVDPGASTAPAGLTARVRPKASPGERAANLGGLQLR